MSCTLPQAHFKAPPLWLPSVSLTTFLHVFPLCFMITIHIFPHCLISVLVDNGCPFIYPTQKTNTIFYIFCVQGKVYHGLAVKFTIRASLVSHSLNCTMVKIKHTVSIHILIIHSLIPECKSWKTKGISNILNEINIKLYCGDRGEVSLLESLVIISCFWLICLVDFSIK